MPSPPSHAATGRLNTAAARTRSAVIRIGRLRERSTTPPIASETRTLGPRAIAASRPRSDGLASTARTAMTGSAVRVIRAPTALTACAAHRRRKFTVPVR